MKKRATAIWIVVIASMLLCSCVKPRSGKEGTGQDLSEAVSLSESSQFDSSVEKTEENIIKPLEADEISASDKDAEDQEITGAESIGDNLESGQSTGASESEKNESTNALAEEDNTAPSTVIVGKTGYDEYELPED